MEHTQLADACLATCSFDTENKYEVTAILCEKQTLYFENKNGIITFNFEISGLTGPTRTLYVPVSYTHLDSQPRAVKREWNRPNFAL